MKNVCYLESPDVESKLSSMGLSTAIIREAVVLGQIRRNGCTDNDPPSTPGTEAWRWTVRTLRELLIPLGWERSNAGGFPRIVDREKRIAIAVNTGADGTGNPDSTPRTKHQKGRITAAVVLKNWQQIKLFDFPTKQETDDQDLPGIVTWFLIVERDGERVNYEIFLPTEIKDNRPDGWIERIIFPPIDLSAPFDDYREPEADKDINVEVSRRKE